MSAEYRFDYLWPDKFNTGRFLHREQMHLQYFVSCIHTTLFPLISNVDQVTSLYVNFFPLIGHLFFFFFNYSLYSTLTGWDGWCESYVEITLWMNKGIQKYCEIRRKMDFSQSKVGTGVQEEWRYWEETERRGEWVRKRGMEEDCVSDKSGPI